MTYENLFAALALQCIPNIGDVNAKKLIAVCGSPEAVFKEKKSRLLKIDGIGTRTLEHIFEKQHFERAEEELRFINDHKIQYSFFTDENYPERLKHCLDGPILIFSSGHTRFTGKRVLSIVGTRQITTHGLRFCEKLIEELVPFDPVIVSGFAYGVDITAQRAAHKNGLQTIGCLAHGLNQTYPRVHHVYRKEIETHGGFITEFHSSSKPDRENFLKRNRIIAGISEATIVVESAEKGGSLVTAALANSYHREVFAVPGRVSDRYSAGCNTLIRTHKAHLLTSAADIVYILGWDVSSNPEPVIQKQLFPELDETEKKIYNFLTHNGKELLDIIALECRLPIHLVSTKLLSMELKGVVRPLPGKLFEAV